MNYRIDKYPITDEELDRIRSVYFSNDISIVQLAKRFNRSKPIVSFIVGSKAGASEIMARFCRRSVDCQKVNR